MLRKSTFREIKTSLARYLAILAIVALGVGFFSGLRDCKESMVSTARAYLERTGFYDYQILSSYGADDDSVALAESWDGVRAAEGSIQIDVMARSGDGDSRALKAISLPENINTLNVTKGRLPENDHECVVDSYSITDDGFRVGDHIEMTDENDKDKLKDFKVTDFEIVGLVNTPIYLDYQRGSTDIGNGSLDTFFFISRDAFDVDYYTNLYVKLDSDQLPFSKEHEDYLKSREDSMEDLAEAVTAGRRETARKEAQEELDEKKQEYEDNLAKYNREKRNAENKIDKTENKIEKGEKTIKKTRKELKAAVKEAKEAINTLPAQIEDLKAGRAIEQPTYSYITCTRLPETVHVEPRDVIIVEGIMTLYDKKLRDQMDLKIFVDAEPDERLLRVIVRDIAERGHPLEMLISKYRNVLKPMHDEFIEPTKQFADIIIPNGGDNERAISMMKLYIMSALKEQKEKSVSR
jgi:putative ABC transport system permease protein